MYADHAGDVVGGIGAGVAVSSWLSTFDTIVSVALGVGGLVALFYSVRLNRAKYKELKRKEDIRNERENKPSE